MHRLNVVRGITYDWEPSSCTQTSIKGIKNRLDKSSIAYYNWYSRKEAYLAFGPCGLVSCWPSNCMQGSNFIIQANIKKLEQDIVEMLSEVTV